MSTFKVGDEVTWCGVSGRVIKDYKFKTPEAASLEVEFDEPVRLTSGKHLQTFAFLYDGRYLPWHKEPSLKKLEKP